MNVRVLSPALEEITEAALWIDSQCPGLGEEFWREVDAKLVEIEQYPRRFGMSEFATPEIELRSAFLRRFKYVIHFAVEVDEAQIVSVAHAARKPGYWLSRRPDNR